MHSSRSTTGVRASHCIIAHLVACKQHKVGSVRLAYFVNKLVTRAESCKSIWSTDTTTRTIEVMEGFTSRLVQASKLSGVHGGVF